MNHTDLFLIAVLIVVVAEAIWFAYQAGQLRSLIEQQTPRKPGIVRRLHQALDRPSELHLPKDYNSEQDDEDREN